VLLAGAICLFSAAAQAEEDAEIRTAARDLATQGAQAFEAGQYAEASDFFRRAHELVSAPSIALLQARSLAKLGHLMAAMDIYEQTARLKLPEDAPEAYAEAVETARGEMEEVRKRLPRLKLSVLGLGKDETARVSIDDKPTPPALLGVERPIDPGPHQMVVRVADQVRSTLAVGLEEGQVYQFELDVQVHPAAKPARRVATRSSSPTLSYVALGIGALGLGLGAYTGLMALHHQSELDSVCHPGCPRSSAGDLASFRNDRTVSWISFGVGIASAASGIALLTLGKPGHEQLSLRALPNTLQIGGQL
jgi:tetratricopeptide (TPR) repeat protein